MTAQTS